MVTSGLVGVFLIEAGFRDQLGQIDQELNSIVKSVKTSKVDKATVALALVNASGSNFSLYIAGEDNEIYALVDKADDLQQFMAAKELAVNPEAKSDIYIVSRELTIEGGLKLIITGSLRSLFEERQSEFFRFILYLFVAGIGATLVLRLVINKDIARESQELQLRERLQSEESRRKMLLEFASDTSHELRTPLTVIKGYLDLIKNHQNGRMEGETLDKLIKESSRLDQNISNLLTMLEFEALEDESLHPLNLSAVLEEELRSFKVIEPQREVSIDVQQDIWIRGSEELVLKLIRNILMNIRRHVAVHSPVNAVLKLEQDIAALLIEDGGPFSPSQSLEISDYLTRFNSSRSYAKGGSGLGFSIMNKSVSKLGGQIQLFKSDLGGLGILVEIPLDSSKESKNLN